MRGNSSWHRGGTSPACPPSSTKDTAMIDASYLLSPMQQEMLFHSKVAQEPGVYVQQHLSTFHEALHIDAFIRAWERVVARHSLLRTAFRWGD
jgi:Condensation domain